MIWGGRHTNVNDNVAQAGVAVVVAIAFAAGTYMAGQSDGKRQLALRDDVKWSAGLLEDVRYLYVDEAPVAFDVATSNARADALFAAAVDRPDVERVPALIEAGVIRSRAMSQQGAFSRTGDSLLDVTYLDGGYFDVRARLHDAREKAETTVRAEPDAAQQDAVQLSRWAVVISTIPFVAAGAYVVFWRLRRRRSAAVAAPGDVGLIPAIPSSSNRPVLGSLTVAAWALLILVPPIQLHYSLKSSEASIDSARAAVAVTRDIEVGNIVSSFRTSVENWLILTAGLPEKREIELRFLSPATTVAQDVFVEADRSALTAYRAIVDGMLKRPVVDGVLDATTVDALTSGPADWEKGTQHQNELSVRAGDIGQRALAMTLALLLAGIAMSLSALSAIERRSFSLPIMTGLTVLAAVVAVLIGLTI